MTWVSALCFGIAAFIFATSLLPKTDWLSPARIFGFVWSIAIGLADLKFSTMQHEWSEFAWLALLLGLFSFLVGVFTIYTLFINNRNLLSTHQIQDRLRKEPISRTRIRQYLFMLFTLYSLCFIVEWMNYGTLPIFASFPDRARNEFPVFGLHLFVGSMPVILFLVVEYLIKLRTSGTERILLAAVFIVTAGSSFLLLNRLFYLLFFVLSIVFAYYHGKMVRFRSILLIVGLFVVLVGYLQYFREVRYARNFLHVVSGMKYSETYAIFSGPYMYIVMNLENFARAVDKVELHTFGLVTFDFLTALTGLKHWVREYFGVVERPFLISGYNTFPFFWFFYYDFGLFGLAFLSFLFGLGTSLVYRWIRVKPSESAVILYSFLVFSVIISFFTFAFNSLSFVFNIVVVALGHWYARSRLT